MEEMIELGILAIIGITLILAITIAVMHFFAQRSQQHLSELSHQSLHSIHSLGINSIIAANEMKIVDETLESRNQNTTASK